jgi:hypothetical protein
VRLCHRDIRGGAVVEGRGGVAGHNARVTCGEGRVQSRATHIYTHPPLSRQA